MLAGVLIAAGCVETRESASEYEFALLGDNPYHPEDVPRFEALIDDVNARPDLRWVLHVGDMQGGQGCSEEQYRRRFEVFQRFRFPLVYTPGDNDWFDCVRVWEGGWDPYERLEVLRSVFYPDPATTTGGRPMPIRRQSADPAYSDFVENVTWTYGDVTYATVHLVNIGEAATDRELSDERLAAAVDWIRRAFTDAREQSHLGVFIATQVDPWVVWGLPVLVNRRCETCLRELPGLEPLYAVLREEASAFAGSVVLAVGDTHIFRVDKPLYRNDGSLVENFTRVETFGDPLVHWVRVKVDPRDRQLFTFHQELVPANVGARHGG